MAIAWVLRGGRVTSALIGASRPQQVIDCLGALERREFTEEELREIDRHAVEGGINCGLPRPSADTTQAAGVIPCRAT